MISIWIYLNILLLLQIHTYGESYFVSYISGMSQATGEPLYQICGYNIAQDGDCLARFGVPGYSKTHPYNILNFAFYLSDGTFADATSIWTNPTTEYFTESFKISITGESTPTDDQFRQSIKGIYIIYTYIYIYM